LKRSTLSINPRENIRHNTPPHINIKDHQLIDFEIARNYNCYFANNNRSEIIKLDGIRRQSITSPFKIKGKKAGFPIKSKIKE